MLLFFAAALWCMVGYVVLLSWDFFRDIDLPIAVVVLLSIGVIAGLVPLLVGRRHRRKLVFWCRRFGNPDALAGQLNRWHGRIIDEASRGIALPVTLQDESIDMPPLVASAVVFPVFLAMMIGSLGSAIWLLELPWFETSLGKAAGFVTVVLAVTAPSVVAVLVARWLGARKVTPENVLRTARRAVRRNQSRAKMLVLQCQSDHWQDCVIELFDFATLAIIDASVPSTNVEWEIETAAERLGPRRLLLIRAEENASAVAWSQGPRWSSLLYEPAAAVNELAAFSRTWREEKHQLVDPDARLGPLGSAIACAIHDWMKQAESESPTGKQVPRV